MKKAARGAAAQPLDREFVRKVNRALLAWYAATARPLKIRERTDPYSVLVSEVMAQQTQISRVDQLATRFLARFPTLESLAAAETADVLVAWKGLGYNRRALALQRAAAAAVAADGLPSSVDALMELPGIGPYTARAVAAIAFGGREIPVDVNITRIAARLVGADAKLSPRDVQQLANEFGAELADGQAGAWAQAAMDLAASTCRAAAPKCGECPLSELCPSAGRKFTKKPRSSEPRTPFTKTARWLRGRLLDELREAGRVGVQVTGERGEHNEAAVTATITTMVSEGLAESLGGDRYRLPHRGD
ncbi:MAG: A/G-specific adenine glycosylase [Candidatus Limnocylindrus sp.]